MHEFLELVFRAGPKFYLTVSRDEISFGWNDRVFLDLSQIFYPLLFMCSYSPRYFLIALLISVA